MKTEKIIEVCDKCQTAACWYGEFMCDFAQIAGTKKMAVAELEKLGLESPQYWSDKKMLEIYGDANPFNSSKI